jgi:hypothetical protein
MVLGFEITLIDYLIASGVVSEENFIIKAQDRRL